MSGRWRCKTCKHVSEGDGDVYRDMAERLCCRRCQYGVVVAVPNRRQVALSLLCERVSVIED